MINVNKKKAVVLLGTLLNMMTKHEDKKLKVTQMYVEQKLDDIIECLVNEAVERINLKSQNSQNSNN
jgi:hypothetical protein